MLWNPSLYLRNNQSRLRPALDLLIQTTQMLQSPLNDIKTVLDLGCGPGNISPHLGNAFPNATITGIDSSVDMIDQANRNLANLPDKHRYKYAKSTIEDLINSNDKNYYDVIYCNAAFHWLPNHAENLPKLINSLIDKKSGGVVAIQMPDTKNQPSHLLMETAALKSGVIDIITSNNIRIPRAEDDAMFYYNLLVPFAKDINIWSTEYIQQLKTSVSSKQKIHPVLEFTKATGLLPILDALGGEQSPTCIKYLKEYEDLLSEQYPVTNTNELYTHGSAVTLFPFKRLFIVCRI